MCDGATSNSRAIANQMMKCTSEGMNASGMLVSTQDPAEAAAPFVGYQPVSRPARVQVPDAKDYALDLALDDVTSRPLVHTGNLHSILGVWIWLALLWGRPTLEKLRRRGLWIELKHTIHDLVQLASCKL